MSTEVDQHPSLYVPGLNCRKGCIAEVEGETWNWHKKAVVGTWHLELWRRSGERRAKMNVWANHVPSPALKTIKKKVDYVWLFAIRVLDCSSIELGAPFGLLAPPTTYWQVLLLSGRGFTIRTIEPCNATRHYANREHNTFAVFWGSKTIYKFRGDLWDVGGRGNRH